MYSKVKIHNEVKILNKIYEDLGSQLFTREQKLKINWLKYSKIKDRLQRGC